MIPPRRRHGVTLIELMITVAMLGLLVGAFGSATRRIQLIGLVELQQEQARLVLDYHAQRLLDGAAQQPTVSERLTAGLPEATVERLPGDGVETLVVTWRDAVGRQSTRSLTVFSP
ncbi:MAG: prepilin-type N-terminal cleavage/methylation domain-containing protein [Myxococcota bacterium]|jgi:prepilin-type N-terminal cleavage/methylation domain-containing protein